MSRGQFLSSIATVALLLAVACSSGDDVPPAPVVQPSPIPTATTAAPSIIDSPLPVRSLETVAGDMDEHLSATLSNVSELIRLNFENQLADANLMKEEILTMGEEMQSLIAELEVARSASDSRGEQNALADLIEQANAVLDSAFVVIVNIELDAIKAAQAFGAIERAVLAGDAAVIQLDEQLGDGMSAADPADRPNPLPLGKPLGELTAAQWELLGYTTPKFPPLLEPGEPRLPNDAVTELWTDYFSGIRIDFDGGDTELVLCGDGRGVFVRVLGVDDLIGEELAWDTTNSKASGKNDASLTVSAVNPDVSADQIAVAGRTMSDNFEHFTWSINRNDDGIDLQTIQTVDTANVRESTVIVTDPDCESYLP